MIKTRKVTLTSVAMTLSLIAFAAPVPAAEQSWKDAAVADALQAAPPAATNDATIYGWTSEGDMVLARYGSGPYTCVASGSFSLRIGKPALPYPDPMCMDQNAWAFFKALLSEKNPAHPEKPYPTAPGLVWMLAGMSVAKGGILVGASEVAVLEAGGGNAESEVFRMTPHVMIMPFPFKENVSGLRTAYDLDHPLNDWIMAANTAFEHLMVHFSAEDVAAMMEAGN
jgi:hypothetical protein